MFSRAFWSKHLELLLSRLPSGTQRVLALVFVGVCVGLCAVAFHYSVDGLRHATIQRLVDLPVWAFLILSFVCVMGASLGASWMIRRFAPEAGGGGVMPTKLAYWTQGGRIPLRTAVVKFFASALTLGGGVSMGPEGPSVQIGAAAASGLGGRLGVDDRDRRLFCACGAAAALAAVFNAPLAAIVFVLEEIIGDLNSRLISGILLAAVVGSLVSHALVGAQPAYQVEALGDASWKGFLLCLLVSAFATCSGVLFQRGSLRLRGRMKQTWKRWPAWLKPCLGALVSWAIASTAFLATGHLGIFGIGYVDVTTAIGGALTWSTAALLWAGKLVATAFAVGSGGCGGIFAPSFFIGAMSGALIAGLASQFMHLNPSDASMLVMAGMCACLGAVIRTPFTCVLLMFEVTHQFAIVPLLILATLISQLLARKLHREGMYEEMMLQDGIEPERVLPARNFKTWNEMPATALMTRAVVSVQLPFGPAWKEQVETTPYRHFPVLDAEGRVCAVVSRDSIRQAGSATPIFEKVLWLDSGASLEVARKLFLRDEADFLCVGNHEDRRLLGVLTLHDFLRSQSQMLDDAGA